MFLYREIFHVRVLEFSNGRRALNSLLRSWGEGLFSGSESKTLDFSVNIAEAAPGQEGSTVVKGSVAQ